MINLINLIKINQKNQKNHLIKHASAMFLLKKSVKSE